MPQKVLRAVKHELDLIRSLKYAPYFLPVFSIVRFTRSQGILCQGRRRSTSLVARPGCVSSRAFHTSGHCRSRRVRAEIEQCGGYATRHSIEKAHGLPSAQAVVASPDRVSIGEQPDQMRPCKCH